MKKKKKDPVQKSVFIMKKSYARKRKEQNFPLESEKAQTKGRFKKSIILK